MNPLFHLTSRLAVAVAGSLSFLIGFVPAADTTAKVLRAGTFAIDITPADFPVSLPAAWHRMADLAHDPLHARCLVLDDGETTLALVCDSCMIPREIFDAAKAQAVSGNRDPDRSHPVFRHAHSHRGHCGADLSKLPRRTTAISRTADRGGDHRGNSQLEPARIGWAVGHNPRQVFNRRWHMRPGFSRLRIRLAVAPTRSR